MKKTWPQLASGMSRKGYTTTNVEASDDMGSSMVFFFPSPEAATWKRCVIHNVVVSGVAGTGSMVTGYLTFWRSLTDSVSIADANFEPIHQVAFKSDQPILPSHPVVVDMEENGFIAMTFSSNASHDSIEAADADTNGFTGRTVNVAFSWEKLATTSL